MREARERSMPVPEVLSEFFMNEKPKADEMGWFALNVSATRSFIEGTLVLIHALNVDRRTVTGMRLLEDYIGVSATDPSIWAASWTIDNAMNWPQGTILPRSRDQLAKI